MPEKLDLQVPFKGPTVPWFVDPTLSRVFSGHEYAHRCVAAIGPADFSRIAFVATSNPRQRAWELGRKAESPFVVHECAWSIARTADRVRAEVVALLTRANRAPVDGFVVIPRAFVRPLLKQATDKAGVPIRWHSEFHAQVLDVETLKLRARLAKAGVDPEVVVAHRCV